MCMNGSGNEKICLQKEELKKVNEFKYLVFEHKKIVDSNNDPILGRFYESELQHSSF